MSVNAKAQDFEAGWWGDCTNTYGEEMKQLVYARLLGLNAVNVGGPGPVIDRRGLAVVDVGGGPVSLLLKTRVARGVVVDPCPYPQWVTARYIAAGIAHVRAPAEVPFAGRFDEAWIYNVLQHVEDPEQVVANARAAAPLVRIFEWIGVPPHPGHPHELRVADLDRWLAGRGRVCEVAEGGAVGRAYVGVFAGA